MKSKIVKDNLGEICGEIEGVESCVVFVEESGEENCDFVGLIYENGKMEVVGCGLSEEVESIEEMIEQVELWEM